MKILVACEFSGIVRDAFIKKGHDAISCDIIDTDSPGPHHKGDVLEYLKHNSFDLMLAFPPCTYLTAAGERWMKDPRYPNRAQDRREAAEFFMALMNADIEKICVENPIGHMTTCYRKPDQIVNPFQYGDPARKRTCLWLKNLPTLQPTDIVEIEYVTNLKGKKVPKWEYETSPQKKGREKARSKTFPGIANAMAEQWG